MKTEITIIPVCQLKAGNQIFLDQDKKPVDVLGIEADPDFPGNTLVIFQRQDGSKGGISFKKPYHRLQKVKKTKRKKG